MTSPQAPRARKEFRTLVSFEEARALCRELIPRRVVERVSLAQALHRRLAEDVVARGDVPPFTRSLMDGFAVRARDVARADEERPVRLRVVAVAEAGRPATVGVESGACAEVATGAPLPEGANAVVPIEYADRSGDVAVIRRGVAVGEHVMAAGDDLMLGDLVAEAGARLGAPEIGALAAAGEATVAVWRRPRVAIASTGDELVEPGGTLAPAQIHDVNASYLAAAVAAVGADPVQMGILPDDPDRIADALVRAAASCDVVITSGSTSAGAGDVVYRILEERGELLAHGIRLEPGKPTVVARLGGTPVFGLPGNPASAAVVFETLVAPLLREAVGEEPEPERGRVSAVLASGVRAAPGRRLLRMVGLAGSGDAARAYPVERRSGAITLLAQADGFVDVPEGVARLEAGERVEVRLLEDRGAPPDLLLVGSHCLGLRPLFRALAPLRGRSVHVGSLGGIRAVSRGVADAAGIHLRTEGGANAAALQALGVTGAALVRGYRRRQGWIVAPGNPLEIRNLGDVLDRRLRTVGRTGGSGTRLLLDELLADEAVRRRTTAEELGETLPGYHVEAPSHSAVAAAVAAGHADAGLGIEAAATLQGLGFVPVTDEDYDFLVPLDALEREPVRALRAALSSTTFAEALGELPGYAIDAAAGSVTWRADQ